MILMMTSTTKTFYDSKRFEMMARASARQIRAILAKMPVAQIFATHGEGPAVRIDDAKSRGAFTFVRNAETGEWFTCGGTFEVRGVN